MTRRSASPLPAASSTGSAPGTSTAWSTTLTDDVRFRALLPSRVLDLTGRDAVRSTFDTWFGGAERWDLVEAVVGEVGGRVHLRWRLSLTNPRVAPGTLLVEQQVYADAGPDGRLQDVSLLCTGYRPDQP